MSNEFVILERRRPSAFTVNYDNGLKPLTFHWNGYVQGKKADSKAVPLEVFNHLNMQGTTISAGELVVSEKTPNKEEILDNIMDLEQVVDNSYSHDEIVALLNGNVNKMKAQLKKITVPSQKTFVRDIAESMSDTLTGAKNDFIKEWFKNNLIEE